MQTSVAFNKMVELGLALGVRDLDKHDGAWVHRVDDQWTIAINGKDDTQRVEIEGGMGATIEPFNAAVWYNGWLAASLSPVEGIFLSSPSGEGANEDSFIAAMDAAISKLQTRAATA